MRAINALRRVDRGRGMSVKYDDVDWVGGFPYEFVGFDTFTAYLEARGFVVVNSRKNVSLGCSEYAVQRVARAKPHSRSAPVYSGPDGRMTSCHLCRRARSPQ